MAQHERLADLAAKGHITNLKPTHPEGARVALLERIENDFTYHKPTDAQILKYTQLREEGKALARLIVNLTPIGREQSLALTHLEHAIMQANAAIARHPEE